MTRSKVRHLRAGIHDEIPAERYHADPCPEPSLSSGIAHQLITHSPRHAWHQHPRLNPNHQEKTAGILDFGSAAHALLLEGIDRCQIIEFDDWRKTAAREARDEAREAGLIPLLRKDYQRMSEFCEAVKTQIAGLDVAPLPLSDGKPEQTLIWKEGSVWCRARVDWLHPGFDVVDDVKTTGTTANPHEWGRTRLFADGKDIQAELYLRGLRALTGQDATWRFLVAEVDPPYAISVLSLTPTARALARRKVSRAIELFRRCLAAGEWPGYPSQTCFAEPPPWEEARFLEAHWEDDEGEMAA